MEVLLPASLTKDNTRGNVGKGRDGFLWLLGLRTGKLCFHLFTSGIGLQLVYQSMPAYSSTPYPNVGDYEGWTRLSPPAAKPSTGGYKANEGSRQPRHHVYAIDYCSSVRRVIRLYQGPLLEHLPWGRMMNPQTSKSIA
jgi:hypothetical protein